MPRSIGKPPWVACVYDPGELNWTCDDCGHSTAFPDVETFSNGMQGVDYDVKINRNM